MKMKIKLKRILSTLVIFCGLTVVYSYASNVNRYGVEQDICVGCGACVEEAPDNFVLYDGVAWPTGNEDTGFVKNAQAACPMGAIWTN
ncbi:MAG: ferredoxin, partial [Prevotellaceae bacterium]|nr:ferredoxin [Prevotellaceae bacterium]